MGADVLTVRVPADSAVHLRGLTGELLLVVALHIQRHLAIRVVVLPEEAGKRDLR